MQLNPQQREAVRYTDGPLLVIAGAGSGKTKVITEKIAYLIRSAGLRARHVAAVTFTNKAAREMRQRVGTVLGGKETRGLQVSTFHRLGLKILRRQVRDVGLKPNFSIYDTETCLKLINDLLVKEQGDAGDEAKAVLQCISNWKGRNIAPDAVLAAAADVAEQRLGRLYRRYQESLRAYNAVDFDDLIALPIQVFERDTQVLDQWRDRIRYLLVDEYQDTNASQYRLIKLLTGMRGALTAVGDDDQSIYAWRGAQPENMRSLKDDFPDLKVITLEQNYRSTQRILKAANHLIANNAHVFEKRLWSRFGYGEPLKVIQARDEVHEAEKVVGELIGHRFKTGADFKDYAILYRGNHQSRVFEKCLREHSIPYRLSGGTSFFALTEIKDIMAYLRVIVNPDDDPAFLRIVNTPRRELGVSTIEKLSVYAQQRQQSLFAASFEIGLQQFLSERQYQRLHDFVHWLAALNDRGERGDPVAVIKDVIRDIDYETWLRDNSASAKTAERRYQNVQDLIGWVHRLAEEKFDALADIVAHLALLDMLDNQDDDPQDDRVALMTLHAAKGLEFPYVFMVGMEEQLLPHRTSIELGQLEEERRLAYVGITRAQRNLTFSMAARRSSGGERIATEPSRFLTELPDEDLIWPDATPVDPKARQERGQAHLANIRGLINA